MRCGNKHTVCSEIAYESALDVFFDDHLELFVIADLVYFLVGFAHHIRATLGKQHATEIVVAFFDNYRFYFRTRGKILGIVVAFIARFGFIDKSVVFAADVDSYTVLTCGDDRTLDRLAFAVTGHVFVASESIK